MALQLSGSLDEIILPDIARLLQSTRRTGRLAIEGDAVESSLYFDRGDIVDASSNDMNGLDALKHLALLSRGTFLFIDGVVAPTRGLSNYPALELIRIMERRMQEARQLTELMPEPGQVPRYLGGSIPSGFEVSAAELSLAMKAGGGTLTTQGLAEHLNLDLMMVRYTVARFRAIGLMEVDDAPVQEIHPTRPASVPRNPPEPPKADPETAPPQPAPPTSSQPRYWRGRRID